MLGDVLSPAKKACFGGDKAVQYLRTVRKHADAVLSLEWANAQIQGIYSDRAFGGDCDYRIVDVDLAARLGEGQGASHGRIVQEQSASVGPYLEALYRQERWFLPE
jgi:hypothetical protein